MDLRFSLAKMRSFVYRKKKSRARIDKSERFTTRRITFQTPSGVGVNGKKESITQRGAQSPSKGLFYRGLSRKERQRPIVLSDDV